MVMESKLSTPVILLATFNGEKYLAEFLESLLAQSQQQFLLVVSDGGSSDSTVDILERFKSKFGKRLIILDSNIATDYAHYDSPVVANFSCLLSWASRRGDGSLPEIFTLYLADQDDIWQPEKLSLFEAEFSRVDGPVLVHSQLRVVDHQLNPLSDSFHTMQGLAFFDNSLSRLLVQNYIPGCSLAINSPLLAIAEPIPNECCMHDWWLALVAAASGKIIAIDKALVQYRQHPTNTIGADAYNTRYKLQRSLAYLAGKSRRLLIKQILAQAKQLQLACGQSFTEEAGEIVTEFSQVRSLSKWRRWQLLRRYTIRRQGLLRQLLLYLEI